jgi:integrase
MKDIADYLEKAHVDTIRADAKACNLMDRLIIRMLWRSGVQVGELLNVKPEDIEFHNQIVNIVKGKRASSIGHVGYGDFGVALRVYFQ